MTVGNLFSKALLACLLVGALAVPALAADHARSHAIYDRTTVSIGTMAEKAALVFAGEVVGATFTDEDVKVLTCKPKEIFKGSPVEQVSFRIDDGNWVPHGEYLVFAVPARLSPWGVLGGQEYGMIPLTKETRDSILATLDAHLHGDAENRAKTLVAGFQGWIERLKRDALVDFYLEPALLEHLTDAQRGLFVSTVAKPALREFFRPELHALMVNVGRIQGRAAFDALVGILPDKEALTVIPAFTKAFESMDPAFVAKNLNARFQAEQNAKVLPAFIAILAELKLQVSFDRVRLLMSHENKLVREFAILGTGDLGTHGSVNALAPVLLDAERPLRERKLAVVAMAYSGDPAGVDRICEFQEKTGDDALREFIQTFRKFPARTRALLLKGKA